MKAIQTAGYFFLAVQPIALLWEDAAAWYVMHVYPWFLWIFGSISGCFPFPVAEAAAYAFLILLIAYTIRFWGKKMGRKAEDLFLRLLVSAAVLAIINGGINKGAPSFAKQESLRSEVYSREELREFCEFLVAQINENSMELSKKNSGQWELEGRQAMTDLGETFSSLDGFYPRPKQMMYSPILSALRLGGIYVPFTVEVIYNGDMEAFNIPFTICHELAHAKGFMREGDANLIAYLACISSESQEYRYSGYLSAWLYAGNELAEADPKEYKRLSEMLSQQAKEDLKSSNAFWRQEAGTLLAIDEKVDGLRPVRDKKNLTGLRSYERYDLVGLMIEEYRGGFVEDGGRSV